MVHEIPRKGESDAQESRSLNLDFKAANSGDAKNIWPTSKAEADTQRDILNRYPNLDTSKIQLPNLGDLQNAFLKNTKLGADLLPLKGPETVVRAADTTAKPTDVKPADGPKQEKVNENGSRLLLNADSSVSKLTRKDGSTVEFSYDKNGDRNHVVETNKDGSARTVWTLNAKGVWDSSTQNKDASGNWVSDGKQGLQYRDVTVDEKGITSAIDLVGFKHVTTASGEKLHEGANYTFDEKGRIASIGYEPGANKILKFHYDANDKLDRVDICNNEGKLQQSRTKTADGEWKVTIRDGSSAGTWQGQMEVTADGNFKEQTAADKAAGQWQVTAAFEKYTEKTSPDGKQISRIYDNKAEYNYEKLDNGQERITKITHGKESREFQYDANGKLSQLIDITANGTQSIKTDGMTAKIGLDGDVTIEKADGSKIIKKSNFNMEEQDKDGNTLKVLTKDGKARTFEYETVNNHKELVKITDTHPGKNGPTTEVWTKKRNADGSLGEQFATTGAGGKEKVASGFQVLYNGDFKYKEADGKERVARMGSDAVSREGGFSSNVDEARDRLKAALEGQMDASRIARLNTLMNELERRAKDSVERQVAAGQDSGKATEKWEKKVAQTYDQLAQMMEQNPSTAVYNQATRAKLVENFMWIAADTTRGAQDVGNCWQMSGRNLTGMQNNPDSMARLLKEVSLTGTFTAVHGGIKSKDSLDRRKGDLEGPRKFTIPKNMLTIDRVNAGWSLDKPNECYWQGGTGTMPSTPVGYIIDNVIGYMGGRTSHGALDGGLWESFNSPGSHTREGWYYGINELMYMATGEKTAKPQRVSSNDIGEGDIRNLTDKRLQKQLLENGGALLVGPGHMFAVKLVKNGNQWQIVTDNQWGTGSDQVIGKVSDLRTWNVQTTRVKYNTNNNNNLNKKA